MRKTLLGVMLAITTALPAMASAQQAEAPQQRQGRGQWRGGGEGRPQKPRQWNGQGRGGQDGRWQGRQGGQPAAPPQPPTPAPQQQVGRDGGQRFQGRGDRGPDPRQEGGRPPVNWNSGDRTGGDRGRGERFGNAPAGRFDGGDRRGGGAGAQWQRGYADRRDDAREGARFADLAQWNRGWRGNDRFDYGGYRSSNRGAFHLPRYYAPRGWNGAYRRYSVGFRLSPLLFDQSYWIDDPYDYRLPPAYGPYRWVRYYNDALLVDVRSGYVVDTVYDIFW